MKKFNIISGLFAVAAAIIIAVVNPLGTHAQLGGVQTWLGTSGGTANAQTLTIHNVVALNDLLGVPLRFFPGNTNTNSATTMIAAAARWPCVKHPPKTHTRAD